MGKLRIGDRVERIGSRVPDFLRSGVVTDIRANSKGREWATEYEVDFKYLKAIFYETQLQLLKPRANSHVEPRRLYELAQMRSIVDQPEWQHIKECADCTERHANFVSHVQAQSVSPAS